MYAYTMIATGTVSTNPTWQRRDGLEYVEIVLCGTDLVEAWNDKEAIHTHVQFMAFAKVAEAVMENLQEGDNVILQAHLIEAHLKEDEAEHFLIIYSFRKHPGRSVQ